jgi:hypothetical protein
MNYYESLFGSAREPIKKPEIHLGNRSYRFVTNVIFGNISLEEEMSFVTPGIVSEDISRKNAQKIANDDNNYFRLVVEFTRRGFGIIPELPASDIYGDTEKANGLISYYEDTMLENGASRKIDEAVCRLFPTEELSVLEIGKLLDTVLAQDEFEPARRFIEELLGPDNVNS